MKDPYDRESYIVHQELTRVEYDLIPWHLEGKGLAWSWKGEAPAAFDPGVQSSLLSWMISLSVALAAPSGTAF